MCDLNLDDMSKSLVLITLIFIIIGCGQHEKVRLKQSKAGIEASVEDKFIESIPDSNELERRIYHSKLQEAHVRFKLLGLLDTADVEYLMPRSDQEFGAFYSLSYPDVIGSRFYFALDSSFLELAYNKENVLLVYLNMSTLVDGEYAESYYENVTFMFDNIAERICPLESSLKKDAKMKLEEYFAEYCR